MTQKMVRIGIPATSLIGMKTPRMPFGSSVDETDALSEAAGFAEPVPIIYLV